MRLKILTVLTLTLALILLVAACAQLPTPTPTPKPTSYPPPGTKGPKPTATPTPWPPAAGIHTSEDLRLFLEGLPDDLKLVVNEDVVVRFCTPDRCIGFITFPARVHHIPSMSIVFLGLQAEVINDPTGNEMRFYESDEGAAALGAVLDDETLMEQIRTRIQELFKR